jgi:hypothetical protein
MLGKVFQQFHKITLLGKRKRKSHPSSSMRHVSGAILDLVSFALQHEMFNNKIKID